MLYSIYRKTAGATAQGAKMNTTEATIIKYAYNELNAHNNAFEAYNNKPDDRILKRLYFESVQRMGVVNELLEELGYYIDIDGKISKLEEHD